MRETPQSTTVRHRTTSDARKALGDFCKAAWGDRANIHIFTIPVDEERDADCVLSDVITERDFLASALESALGELKKLKA
jgi:hypothetical protein